ncbi:MAG: hypothetical protein NZ902_04960 [Acidilobaceae archaeon]|nr:hypothetical protein [Acidilobaceae archaeon]MCX8165918.1 hypothetical protein [Acidilobaceae archaeon]MDW7974561.1 hypothetical protein [Sulfolobales archaeon]
MKLTALNKLVFVIVAVYIVSLSFVPLVNSFFRNGEWVGFERGAYYYRNNKLEVRIAGFPEGLGKPRIYIYAPNSSYRPIMLVEFDDRETTVNGYSLYHDLENLTLRKRETTVILNYELKGEVIVRKIIWPEEERVTISLESEESSEFVLVMKGRNCSMVNGMELGGSRSTLEFYRERFSMGFEVKGVGKGVVDFNLSSPAEVKVLRDKDRCTIAIEYYGERLSMTVRGEMESTAVSPISILATNVVNHRFVQILLPLVAIGAVALGWALWRKM